MEDRKYIGGDTVLREWREGTHFDNDGIHRHDIRINIAIFFDHGFVAYKNLPACRCRHLESMAFVLFVSFTDFQMAISYIAKARDPRRKETPFTNDRNVYPNIVLAFFPPPPTPCSSRRRPNLLFFDRQR